MNQMPGQLAQTRMITIEMTDKDAVALLQILNQTPMPYQVSHPLITRITEALAPKQPPALADDIPDETP